MKLFLERVPTPLGCMLVATDDKARLRVLDWADFESSMMRLLSLHYRGVQVELIPTETRSAATSAMLAYFDGDLAAPDSLEVATGGTEFQRLVWQELRNIPASHTISYSELAKRIGRPSAIRAVGMANGANPVSVVVPCHRVIGANSALTGYGGGLPRKQWLLAHERTHAIPGKPCGTLALPGF